MHKLDSPITLCERNSFIGVVVMSRHFAQRGQVLPLVALAVVVLMGAVGFAVDVGYHQYRQRVQQTATDSAAIAAANEVLAGNYAAAAKQDASLNGFTDGTANGACDPTATTCVVVTKPIPSPDPFSNTANAVQVVITTPNQTFFERVFGINSVAISTKAVGVLVNQNSNACVFVLSGGANFNGQTGGGQVNAPNCSLVLNGGANFHAATVNAAGIYCSPTASACGGGTYTSATPQPAAPASDPCPSITYCAYLANNPPTCGTPSTAPKVTNGKPVTVPAGCYSGLDLKKASSVTFNCGLYMITGTLDVRATGNNPTPINISQSCGTSGSNGVTFYLSGGGSIDFGNDNINLSAPTSGDYNAWSAGEQNVLIYQAPSDTSTVNLQSASCGLSCSSIFSGMIYAPSATLNYNQYSTTTGGAVLIVSGTLNANGGINNVLAAPGGPGPYVVKTAVLGE